MGSINIMLIKMMKKMLKIAIMMRTSLKNLHYYHHIVSL